MIYVTIINSRKAVRIKYARTIVITVNVNSGHLFILKCDDMPDFLISEACEAAEVLKREKMVILFQMVSCKPNHSSPLECA